MSNDYDSRIASKEAQLLTYVPRLTSALENYLRPAASDAGKVIESEFRRIVQGQAHRKEKSHEELADLKEKMRSIVGQAEQDFRAFFPDDVLDLLPTDSYVGERAIAKCSETAWAVVVGKVALTLDAAGYNLSGDHYQINRTIARARWTYIGKYVESMDAQYNFGVLDALVKEKEGLKKEIDELKKQKAQTVVGDVWDQL